MKTPTAEDLINEVLLNIDHSPLKEAHYTAIKEAMIEFARLHVEAALKEAAEQSSIKYDHYDDDISAYVDTYSILNAYPLTLIK